MNLIKNEEFNYLCHANRGRKTLNAASKEKLSWISFVVAHRQPPPPLLFISSLGFPRPSSHPFLPPISLPLRGVEPRAGKHFFFSRWLNGSEVLILQVVVSQLPRPEQVNQQSDQKRSPHCRIITCDITRAKYVSTLSFSVSIDVLYIIICTSAHLSRVSILSHLSYYLLVPFLPLPVFSFERSPLELSPPFLLLLNLSSSIFRCFRFNFINTFII